MTKTAFLKILKSSWLEENRGEIDLTSMELISTVKKTIDLHVPPEYKDRMYSFSNKLMRKRIKKNISKDISEPLGDMECFTIKWLNKQIKKQQKNDNS